ncbi:hormogonium polysaccharide biosynthesis protein HpsL [Anabaena cylindrica UHCC 0172]|uniref:hormogonium polysaccharide biosynthesis protein HpsL n=1 Tax=Anabaena cylindrica TaxID=1165 RepID=UPI002B1FBE8D|nr:hormogonium polysaccharide biosynthesis protein HpsL [Anabaena cylindrica]MEA5552370.1 hormogonium polysaccharide biosynthesis protein HpsL [Anabaena cylindrica UHCC 0172]
MAKTKKSRKAKKQSSADTPTLSLKEQLAQKRQATLARKEFISLLTTAGGTGLFLGLMIFFVGGIKLAIPAVLGIVILSFSYKYPRHAIYAFIIYLPFAGTIIYYIGNNPVIQLAKDAFYVPAAIALWQTCRKKKQPFIVPQAIKTPLWIVFGCSMLTLVFINGGQQLDPSGGDIPLGLGILGLKVFLGYLPLISCAYYLIRNQQDFLLLSRTQIVLILVCCLLGIMQYFLLTIGVCKGTVGVEGDALFKATLEARCYVGGALLYTPEQGVIRLPGTFVAPWQWSWFLISSTFFTFATSFSDRSIIWRIIGLVTLALVFMNAVVSGQRIALALVPTCFVLLLFLTGQIGNLKRFIPIGGAMILILGIAMAANPVVVQDRLDSFTSRWNASPPQAFIVDQFEDNWKSVKTPIGSGLGRATNSARALGSTKLVETYYPKLLYEVGIVGVLAFLGLVTSITIATFKVYRSIKDRNLRTYAASMWVFILAISYNTYYYPLDVDPVCVYYWLSIGILLKLQLLDQQLSPEERLINQKGQKKRPLKNHLRSQPSI